MKSIDLGQSVAFRSQALAFASKGSQSFRRS
jgi:hypothetical protein